MQIGEYSGEVAAAWRTHEVLAALAALPAHLAAPDACLVSEGRNRNIRIRLPVDGPAGDVLVKAFGRQTAWRDRRARHRGSKARRTWQAAVFLSERGVGTPAPVAYLERWESGRLVESYFLSQFKENVVSFTDALVTLYHDDPACARFMALMEVVAGGVRVMHDAGFLHNDLGNQNILLRPSASGWRDFAVIDLNRGRRLPSLTHRQRARDLSRIALPSDFLRVFIEMYWRAVPPRELLRWERWYRRRYAWHERTRRLRHPVREARQSERDRGKRVYPPPRDLWVWDERSAQAINTLRPRDRARHYPFGRHARIAVATARAGSGVWRAYRELMRGCFREPVAMGGRIGVAIDPAPGNWAREAELLGALGRVPALVRLYHHESVARRRERLAGIRRLHAQGHPVTVALVQDRRAVREPDRWHAFALDVLEHVGDVVDAVEVGHAINRVKWGIWDCADLRALYRPLPALARRFPGVRFMGPAAIDFEYPFVLSARRQWPAAVPLSALSHHLYVDRRGAPENAQGSFSAIEKFALARAIARRSPGCADRLVVSEVNWPILGTGVDSPVNSPYASPGPRHNDPSVDEDTYADYMLRYLCLAIGSGLVDRVFWWRLVARGFGLVDDTDPDAWRPRAAYHMLARFLNELGEAIFTSAVLPSARGRSRVRHGVYRFEFERCNGERVALQWAHGGAVPFPADAAGGSVEDAFGKRLAALPATLGPRPVYMRAAKAL